MSENQNRAKSFTELNLNPWIVRQCTSIGLKHPTPIQLNCIPEILRNRDVIGAAKTGSGKTLAFALPIVQRLCEDPYGIFALVLTPTRELAFQIADQFAVIGKPMKLKHCVIVGGMDMCTQAQELARKPHIVLATPGRLADHIQSSNLLNFANIKFLVLDEADRLLGGHFDEQISTIFKALPKSRQTLFFSATVTETLEKLQEAIGTDVFLYEDPAEVATVAELQQYYVLTPYYVRDAYLVETIRTFRANNTSGNIMVFTDTCKKCQILSMMLNEVGFENVALHAMIPQQQRLAALARFKSNTVKILVATDVASRGLDIPSVQLVVNHNVPELPKEYIHRVGRTARAGKGGLAVTLVSPFDLNSLYGIEERIKIKLSQYKIDESEVGNIFTQISVTESEAQITLDEKGFYEKRLINLRKKWILDGLNPDEEEAKLFNNKKHKDKKLKGKKRKKNKKQVEQIKNSAPSDL